MSKTIKVESIKKFGQGKVCEITYSFNGQTGKAKAWAGDVEEGKEYTGEFKKKPGYNNGPEETWFEIPKAGRGGFGGGPKADPAKLALEQQKHEDFLKKWDKDREAEAQRQASIASQVIVKAAVDLAVAANTPEPSAVNAFALDLTETLRQTHDQVFKAIATRAAGGK